VLGPREIGSELSAYCSLDEGCGRANQKKETEAVVELTVREAESENRRYGPMTPTVTNKKTREWAGRTTDEKRSVLSLTLTGVLFLFFFKLNFIVHVI